jgi:L-ribulose-5-phosphate 4-epimerase
MSSETVDGRPATAAELREQVSLGCRVLDLEDQGDLVWGHVSARDPEGRGVWMKASTYGFDEVGPDEVILVSRDGEVLEGDGRRHVEYPLHTEAMAARPDVNAVVHTHPLYSVAFAATGQPLKALSHEGMHFVPPAIPRFEETGDLVRTPELGVSLAETLGDKLGVLMPRHGITTVGGNVGDAVAAAVHLERACQIQLLAGPDAVEGPDEEALLKREQSGARHLSMAWEYLSRTVGAR